MFTVFNFDSISHHLSNWIQGASCIFYWFCLQFPLRWIRNSTITIKSYYDQNMLFLYYTVFACFSKSHVHQLTQQGLLPIQLIWTSGKFAKRVFLSLFAYSLQVMINFKQNCKRCHVTSNNLTISCLFCILPVLAIKNALVCYVYVVSDTKMFGHTCFLRVCLEHISFQIKQRLF